MRKIKYKIINININILDQVTSTHIACGRAAERRPAWCLRFGSRNRQVCQLQHNRQGNRQGNRQARLAPSWRGCPTKAWLLHRRGPSFMPSSTVQHARGVRGEHAAVRAGTGALGCGPCHAAPQGCILLVSADACDVCQGCILLVSAGTTLLDIHHTHHHIASTTRTPLLSLLSVSNSCAAVFIRFLYSCALMRVPVNVDARAKCVRVDITTYYWACCAPRVSN